MLLARLNHRDATAIRLVGLALLTWTVFTASHRPGTSGRGLVITLLYAASAAGFLAWTARPDQSKVTLDLYLMAAAGGGLTGASRGGAASAFVFIAVIVAGLRVDIVRALPVLAIGVLGLAVSILIYSGSALGLLAYTLGYAAGLLAASNSRQTRLRADQAELLLAQTQRSHEEQLRVARLEESARIAREIHDVLAHALAGLTIQLEATASLLEQGADRQTALARVQRAHELAREGLHETRRAVGALRGEMVSPVAEIESLVADYRESAQTAAELTIDGDPARLAGEAGQAVLRVVQEALTNVRKHAPGAEVSVAVHAGASGEDDVVVVIDDRPTDGEPTHDAGGLAATGGGFGLQGMRERARLLGGTLNAGAAGDGWRVELRLPPPTQVYPTATVASERDGS